MENIRLVIFRKQDRRHGAITLGDDVKLRALAIVEEAEESSTFTQGAIVFGLIVIAQLAPVAIGMTTDTSSDVIGVQTFQRIGCDDPIAEGKERGDHCRPFCSSAVRRSCQAIHE